MRIVSRTLLGQTILIVEVVQLTKPIHFIEFIDSVEHTHINTIGHKKLTVGKSTFFRKATVFGNALPYQ